MKVGDLVKHKDYPLTLGVVLSYDEYGCLTIKWLTSIQPTIKGMISEHKYWSLILLSEA